MADLVWLIAGDKLDPDRRPPRRSPVGAVEGLDGKAREQPAIKEEGRLTFGTTSTVNRK